MRYIALITIRFYQQFLSPHKGFFCAYRVHTGRASCSQLGYRAIQRWGVWGGIRVLRSRLFRCGVAHRRYGPRPQHWQRQAGFCDVSCDLPCDVDPGSLACDGLSSCTPCDCGDWSFRRKKDEERWVHIPPYAKLLSIPSQIPSQEEAPRLFTRNRSPSAQSSRAGSLPPRLF